MWDRHVRKRMPSTAAEWWKSGVRYREKSQGQVKVSVRAPASIVVAGVPETAQSGPQSLHPGDERRRRLCIARTLLSICKQPRFAASAQAARAGA